MKYKDYVLVIYNDKGIEKNFVCAFDTFIKQYSAYCDSDVALNKLKMGIVNTVLEENTFYELYIAANKSMYIRCCKGIDDLKLFVTGKYNDNAMDCIDSSLCDNHGLSLLRGIGITTSKDFMYRYEKSESLFEENEIYHTFTGKSYLLMEIYPNKNMLFKDVNSNLCMVINGAECFIRCPRGEDISSEKCMSGIVWKYVIYTDASSTKDFDKLRKEHGMRSFW